MKLIITCLLVVTSLSCLADTYAGKIKIEKGSFNDGVPPVINHTDENISYSVKFFVNKFVNDTAIFAFTRVKNHSKEEGRYAFYVALLDASDNLIATSRHTTTLKAGEDTQLGGLYSEVSGDQWKKVTSYKYTVIKL